MATISYRQGADLWLTPIVIEEGTMIGWTETAGPLTATIPAGTYWGWADSGPGADYPSLYGAIASAMGGVSFLFGNAVSYSFDARTPRWSVGLAWGGVALKGSKADFLGLDLDNTNAQILFDALGFGSSLAGGVIASAPQVTGSGREVVGWLSRAGCWLSPVYASSRLRTPRRLIEHSTIYTERADAYAVDYGERATRSWTYEWVPSAHVFGSRAADIQYADAAGLYLGDVHNAWEDVWRSLAQLDDVIVIHHLDGEPIDLKVSTHKYDVVRIADVAQAQDFTRTVELLRTAGEWWRINVDCAIRSSNNGY